MVTIKFQTKIQHLYPVLAEGVGISEEKLNDLQRLLRYLSPEAQDFYENLFKDTAVKLKNKACIYHVV